MGQYYKPIILEEKSEHDAETIDRWWLACDFDNGSKLMEHSWIGNDFVAEVEHYLINNLSRLVWAGDYADNEEDGVIPDTNLYIRCERQDKQNPTSGLDTRETDGMFVINHDKKEYYIRPAYDKNEWQVNPLPILTSEGNGRGGGDYRGEEELVGSWARDHIEYSQENPGEDYTEIHPGFKDDL